VDLLGLLTLRALVRHDRATDTYTLHDLLFDYTRATAVRPQAELHRLLADGLLDRWGGLPAVPALTAPYDDVDRYGLAALVPHLLAAGDRESVGAVLFAERVTAGGRPTNAWWAAHEDVGRPDGYVASVRKAWADARARHGDPVSIAREATYALLLGSLTDRAADIPSSLLSRLAETGTWPIAHALTYAQMVPSPVSRFHALTALLPHLPAGQRPPVVAQALATSRGFDHPRTWALATLLPYLPSAQRAAVAAEALEVALAVDDPRRRAEAWVALAPHLAGEQRTAALADALTTAIGEAGQPDMVLLRWLAPHLSVDQLAQALDTATTTRSRASRVEVLAALAPHLPEGLLGRAAKILSSWVDDRPGDGERALAALVPYLPAHLFHAMLADAASGTEPDRWARLWSAAALPPDLVGRRVSMPVAVAASACLSVPELRAAVLTRLAPDLPDELVGAAMDAARTIREPRSQALALAAVAPRVPPEARRPAIAAALAAVDAIPNPGGMTMALRSLAPHIPADLLDRALAVALTADYWPGGLTETLTVLAPHLPAELLGRALEAVASGLVWHEGRAIVGRLAPHLTVELLDQALRIVTAEPPEDVAELAAFVSYLPAEHQPPVVALALAAARTISRGDHRARALALLAPYLPADQRAEVMTQAFEAVTGRPLDFLTLVELGPRLPAELFDAAHAAANALGEPVLRTRALAALAPLAPADDRERVLGQVLDGLARMPQGVVHDSARAVGLTRVTPDLPAGLLDEALLIAVQVISPSGKARALGAIARRLPAERRAPVLARAVRAAATGKPAEQAHALVELASSLSPDLLTVALAAADHLDEPDARARALAGLAPALPVADQPPVLGRALSAARSVTKPAPRANRLLDLLPRLPANDQPPLVMEAEESAALTAHHRDRALTLARVAGHLPHPQRDDLLTLALEAAAQDSRSTIAQVLGTAIAAGLPDEATTAVVAALCDIHRWWPLTRPSWRTR
jgi:hypothetical protein